MAFARNTEELLCGLGLLNSSVAMYYLRFLAPTLDYSEGPVGSVPYLADDVTRINELVECSIAVAKNDYDSFEESWEFGKHPLL